MKQQITSVNHFILYCVTQLMKSECFILILLIFNNLLIYKFSLLFHNGNFLGGGLRNYVCICIDTLQDTQLETHLDSPNCTDNFYLF
jgi:hypothetical protein